MKKLTMMINIILKLEKNRNLAFIKNKVRNTKM